MGYWADFRVRISNFCKRNKRKIFVFLIIWFIVIIINYILKNQPEKLPEPSTTYTPHISVVDNEKEVPEKYQGPIENIIDTYFNYCNNKEYDKAYNLITYECKEKYYPTLEQFTGYINEIFQGKKKIYNIQNYSIVDNKYIYNIRILDDILANGTTDGYYYYEEKFVLTQENGKMKLSIAEYVGDEKTNITIEDDNMIVEILNKSIDYETETYTIKITNKTDKYIVISDNKQNNEILLDLGNQTRVPINMQLAYFYVNPNSTKTQDVQFTKFYDESAKDVKLILGSIRIFKDYDWKQGTTQENLNNAIKLYGLEIGLENK